MPGRHRSWREGCVLNEPFAGPCLAGIALGAKAAHSMSHSPANAWQA